MHIHNNRLQVNSIYYYTKEKIVCTVKYAGNCQSVKSNKNAEKHWKNIGKTKERLAFWGGIWYAI